MQHVLTWAEQTGRDLRNLIRAVELHNANLAKSVIRNPQDTFQRGRDDPRARTILGLGPAPDPRATPATRTAPLPVRRASGIPLPVAGPGVRVTSTDPRLTTLLTLTRFRWVKIVSKPK